MRVLVKFQETRELEYTDDVKAKLSVSLQVLAELKPVFKEDTGLELNVVKTTILPVNDVTQQTVFDVTHGIIVPTPY